MEGFTTLTYLLSFPGMIAAVIMLTQFTKKMFDKLLDNQTKVIVYGYAAILSVVAGAFQGKFTTSAEIIETCLIWTINSIIVWFAAMKSFEMVDEKVSKNV